MYFRCGSLAILSPESLARATMGLDTVLTGVLTQFDALRPEDQANSDLQPLNTKLPLLLQLTEELTDENPLSASLHGL